MPQIFIVYLFFQLSTIIYKNLIKNRILIEQINLLLKNKKIIQPLHSSSCYQETLDVSASKLTPSFDVCN